MVGGWLSVQGHYSRRSGPVNPSVSCTEHTWAHRAPGHALGLPSKVPRLPTACTACSPSNFPGAGGPGPPMDCQGPCRGSSCQNLVSLYISAFLPVSLPALHCTALHHITYCTALHWCLGCTCTPEHGTIHIRGRDRDTQRERVRERLRPEIIASHLPPSLPPYTLANSHTHSHTTPPPQQQ